MSKWYSDEEKQIIEKVKEYLKCIRTLKQERLSLKYEYDDIPLPQSPNISDEMPEGSINSKDKQLNSYICKKELLALRLRLFDKIIDCFEIKILMLERDKRNIVRCFINSCGYSDMINMLNKYYFISESTYIRKIPEICLQLANFIDYENIITIDDLNNQYIKMIKNSVK